VIVIPIIFRGLGWAVPVVYVFGFLATFL